MKKSSYYVVCLLCVIIFTTLHVINYNFFFDGTFFNDNGIISLIALAIFVLPLILGLRFKFKNIDCEYKYKSCSHIPMIFISLISFAVTSYSTYLFAQDIHANASLHQNSMFLTPLLYSSYALCGYLLLQTIFHISGTNGIFNACKIISIIPIIWSVFLVLYAYIHCSVSLILIENIFAIIAPSILAISLIFYSKILFLMDSGKTYLKKLTMVAGLSFTLCTTYFLSNTIMKYLEIENAYELPIEIQTICFILSLNVLAFLFFANFEKKDIYINPRSRVRRYKK